MLQNFLWFFSLIQGAYFIALTAVTLSFGLLFASPEFLAHSGTSQGIDAFDVIFLISALLLLSGIYKVNLSVIQEANWKLQF